MTQLQTWIDQLENNTNQPSLKAEFQVVTPMFIGDGAQSASSIRPPSIKGALRFWWRALNWSRCLQETDSETKALNQLHDEEAAIFGLAAKQDKKGEQQGGQGLFTLKVSQPDKLPKVNNWPANGNSPCGFIGFGLWGTNTSKQREAIAEGVNFTVELIFKKDVTDTVLAQLKEALIVFGLLGSLGSRARRGFGSVSITSINDESLQFSSLDEYRSVLDKYLPKDQSNNKSYPAFTAWTVHSSVYSYGSKNEARQALQILNASYKEARSVLSIEKKAYFGLPLADHDTKNRRSSPFIMHIHPIGGAFQALVSFLPANFHDKHRSDNSEFAKTLNTFISASQEQVL